MPLDWIDADMRVQNLNFLIIDLEDRDSVELHPHQGYVVPRGVVHKTRAPEKTVVLMIETAGIIPTGDEST